MKLNESAKSFASANAEDRLCRMNLRASFRVLALVSLSAIALALPASAERKCSSGEIARVFGKIQFVSSFPDYKVQVVTSFPDLKVRKVTSFPDAPGKWQIVESFPDFKIQIVDSFPDFKIQYVESFPGLAR
jgi:hypothetical protein